MAWMTRQDITIGGYQLMELSQFQIQAEVNQHGKLYLEGMLSEDTVRRLETTDQSGQTIQIIAAGKVIFTGQPERIEIRTFNGCHTMKLEAAGFSNQLSLVPHSYFYQDTAQSYEDMLRKAVEHCGGSLIAVQGQERIPAPVLQYCQSAWDFGLRTASMLHTVIVPNLAADYPQICLGLPEGTRYEVNPSALEKRVAFSRQRYDEAAQTGQNHTRQEYISYICEDERIFCLGDRITADGDEWAVMSLSHSFKDGVLINQYILGAQAGFALPYRGNPVQTGLMLEGTVKAVEGESVQVCLQIPDDAQEGKASWFEYAPAANNGMYAMPPAGTVVSLEWMGQKDGECKAVRTVRGGEKLPDYAERSMITEYGKQMNMGPSALSFLSDSNWIGLEDGIKLNTAGRLKLSAGRNISIHSRKSVSLRMPQQLFMSIKGIPSSIWMEGGRIHIKSAQSSLKSNNGKAMTAMPYREIINPVALQAGTVLALAGMTPATAGGK